jgi:mitochondrial import inner membrane translocase subunit TIM16
MAFLSFLFASATKKHNLFHDSPQRIGCVVVPIDFFLKHIPIDNNQLTPTHRIIIIIMAVGPLARLLAQVIVPVIAVMARALPAAYAQALQNARKAGVSASTEATAPVFGKRISRSEALQVLNVTEQELAADPELIQKVRPVVVWMTKIVSLGCLSEDSSSSNPSARFSVSFVDGFNPIQQFDKYFAANDVSKGGSFYLQSKFYRAKELLTEFQNDKRKEEMEQSRQQQQSTEQSQPPSPGNEDKR